MFNELTENEREKKWQRQDDARTLARAEAIRADKNRLAQAKIGAREILEEDGDRIESLAKIANMKVSAVTGSSKKRNVVHKGWFYKTNAIEYNIYSIFIAENKEEVIEERRKYYAKTFVGRSIGVS